MKTQFVIILIIVMNDMSAALIGYNCRTPLAKVTTVSTTEVQECRDTEVETKTVSTIQTTIQTTRRKETKQLPSQGRCRKPTKVVESNKQVLVCSRWRISTIRNASI